ncbi:accessory Sec system glycosylation protein GtfA [Staphylococcus auricularis]|uniref:accessory Sec system glycosyltransferase GtfA n=1 Tax=Staphylococcus auricularis TaxID=29379 RepID=UPI0019327A67|nr:accessory Sec system glycosyltransferase GtfA [Staphylococcus auricularis]MCG7340756.1 accessory Sec system glycosyltransferase GtfA [Staphylococcus auricularis]
MTIYNINFGIGWASSGVEYAQAYRAKLLRQTTEDAKFIFLDFIQSENIQTLTSNMGFKDDEIIWLYQYFSDIKIAPTTYTIDDIKRELGETVFEEEHDGKVKRLYYRNENSFVTCYLQHPEKEIVDRAEFVINGMLVRKDFYSYVRVFSEYYAPHNDIAKLYMRQFYNEDGSIVYNEYIDGEDSFYAFPDAKLYSKPEFVAYFIDQLGLTSDDILILDRSTDVAQSVLQHKGDSQLGVVVHAEHYSENATNEEHVLWNNYYEYQFNNADEFDFFITATERQNQIMREQFEQYYGYVPPIYTIPVGSLHQLTKPKAERKPYSMVSASRLASEKHIDWLVRAAILAKKEVPELTFDIYGEGGERSTIAEIIKEHEAEDYIRLLGHVNLDEVYVNYDLFVSASTSEGFGLTLMEAVGSGLGMLGFDVNYGNPTFIRDGENGYIVPIDQQQDELEDLVQRLSEHMVRYFNDGPSKSHQASYDIAKPFKTENIVKQWQNLIEEVRHD